MADSVRHLLLRFTFSTGGLWRGLCILKQAISPFVPELAAFTVKLHLCKLHRFRFDSERHYGFLVSLREASHMRHALLEFGDSRIQNIDFKTSFDVTASNESKRHKVIALIALGKVISVTQILECKHSFFVWRELRHFATLCKLLVQEPSKEHKQSHTKHSKQNIEPLRQTRIA